MLKSAAFLLALLPAAAQAQSVWEDKDARVETVSYTCSNTIDDLSVAYFSVGDAASFAALQIGGVVHAMVQGPSGSGVRFLDIDAQSGYIIHTKGNNLLLLRQEPGATEEQVLAECMAPQG